MAIRKLTAAEVAFEVRVEADEYANETEIRGSFASDEQADEIIARLRSGDATAYCGVVVTATWEHAGITYTGHDSIWGCTLSDDYTAETVAEEHGMRAEALDDLNRCIAAAVDAGKKLASKLSNRKASR